jgi:hypothetical protein
VVWCGLVCYSLVLLGAVWCGLVWFGVIWFGLVWFDLSWLGVVLVVFGVVWCSLVWFGGWGRNQQLKALFLNGFWLFCYGFFGFDLIFINLKHKP